jgi:hypothetical protein
MAKPSLSSLASGLLSRVTTLASQAAGQARTRGEAVARAGLTKASKLLDQAIAKTAPELPAPKVTAKKPKKAKRTTTKATALRR